MNDCGFVASPLDNGSDPVDFAPHTISINKANGNLLINSARSLIIFYGHDGFFLTNPSSIFL
jgi:hypothetical protein